MSELGGYLRERFEEIVDPIDIDALIDELLTGQRTVSPLPPRRRDRMSGWLIAAAAAAIVLVAGAAWLLLASTNDVEPADQPPLTDDRAIGIVQRLIDAVNQNDFDTYVALHGEHRVDTNDRDLLAFSHELQGAWELTTCWAFDPSFVDGTGVTCNATYQSEVRRLLNIPAHHERLHFRVTEDGAFSYSTFHVGDSAYHATGSQLWEWALATIEAEVGAVDLDPATRAVVDPCNATDFWEGPQLTRACSDWIWEQIDEMFGTPP